MSSVQEQWLEAIDPEVLLRRRERMALAIGGVVLLLLVLGAAYLFNRPGPPPGNDVLGAAEYAVANSIKPRGTLHFNSLEEAQITQKAPNLYEVRGWVMDLAPTGESQIYIYVATVQRDENRKSDRVRDISVVPEY